MAREKVAVTLDAETLGKLDRLVRRRKFSIRSQAIQEAVEEKLWT
jgi:metal-responsive CopG/Arc/MetJ family transcriptional regulator